MGLDPTLQAPCQCLPCPPVECQPCAEFQLHVLPCICSKPSVSEHFIVIVFEKTKAFWMWRRLLSSRHLLLKPCSCPRVAGAPFSPRGQLSGLFVTLTCLCSLPPAAGIDVPNAGGKHRQI